MIDNNEPNTTNVDLKPSKPLITSEEPIIQTDWERENHTAHRIYQPTEVDLLASPQITELEGSSVNEEPQQSLLGIPVTSKIQLHRYETSYIKTVGKEREAIEHNYGSMTAEGESLGETEQEVKVAYANYCTSKGINVEGLDLVVGPAYKLVKMEDLIYPERILSKLTIYSHYKVPVSIEKANKFRPWEGRIIQPMRSGQ